MKEIWEVDPDKHNEGEVTHTMGWPLGGNAGGGSFIYHLGNNQVYVGFVVHLNYRNPHLYPLHGIPALQASPDGRELLRAASAWPTARGRSPRAGISRCPKMVAPGVALLGCSVGMVNVPRIKGNHNAMLSGKAAAEAAHGGDRGRPRRTDELDRVRDEVRDRAPSAGPQEGAQRQADVVEMGADRPR